MDWPKQSRKRLNKDKLEENKNSIKQNNSRNLWKVILRVIRFVLWK